MQDDVNKQTEANKQAEIEVTKKIQQPNIVSDVKIEGFRVSYKLNLISDEGAHNLIIDSQVPMSRLILQSKQNVDVLSVKNNLAKISRLVPENEAIQCLTHLFVDTSDELGGESRLEIKVRTSEG